MLTLLAPIGAAETPDAPRCPRCERAVAPEDLEDAALDELRLIDPHLDRYAHRALGGEIAVCAACGRQLDALAEEMEAYRRRLIRRWPTPTSYRSALMDDQCLSRPFEAVRDTALMEVLATAIWHDRHGATAYLTVYEDGDWSVDGVPQGRAYDRRDDRGYLAVPIPMAPRAATLTVADGDALSADALYRRCIETDADHAPLERELATRFYRALYCREAAATKGATPQELRVRVSQDGGDDEYR